MLSNESLAVIASTSTGNKFCYNRAQAEKINTCLEMQQVYEEIQLTRLSNPLLNPPPQLDFWHTDVGEALIFLGGFALGVGVTISFK